MKKPLVLPTPPANTLWTLTKRDKMFLDLTLLYSIPNVECYQMIFGEKFTKTKARQLSSAVYTSMDGADYLSKRRKQIEDYFWPEKEEEGDVPKNSDGFSKNFVPDVIKKMETIIKNPNDPNYFDAMKIALQKVLKDMDVNKSVEGPKRYLPVVPCEKCRYRLFIEKEVEDECEICKYKAYGEKHGLHYDYKTQLDYKKEEKE